jgi:hypothetical protein
VLSTWSTRLPANSEQPGVCMRDSWLSIRMTAQTNPVHSARAVRGSVAGPSAAPGASASNHTGSPADTAEPYGLPYALSSRTVTLQFPLAQVTGMPILPGRERGTPAAPDLRAADEERAEAPHQVSRPPAPRVARGGHPASGPGDAAAPVPPTSFVRLRHAATRYSWCSPPRTGMETIRPTSPQTRCGPGTGTRCPSP